MKRLLMTTYRFRDKLNEADIRELTKKFLEFGNAPGTIAHYERLDGQGGFVLQQVSEDPAAVYENTLRYTPWVEFESYPVATIEEAFPVIQRVYG